jgi:Phage P22-like portal protein
MDEYKKSQRKSAKKTQDELLKSQDQLQRIKENTHRAYEYYKPNYDRFNQYNRYVFDTSVSDTDKAVLQALNKPQLEFNVLEAYVSRLRGEFSKQIPSISVFADDGAQVDPQIIQIVEDHLRHVFCQANKDGLEYHTYTDTLAGGFSAIKIKTDYAHPMSMNQIIILDKCWDPTLCFFDPLAVKPSKYDGSFCGEIFPMRRKDFEEQYPDIDVSNFKYSKNIEGFVWAYNNSQEDILLICDYYEKKKKEITIVQLSNGRVIEQNKYDEFVEEWNKSNMMQAPKPMGKPRKTMIETICRYRFIETEILEYVETDYKFFPLIFVDGNSRMVRHGVDGRFQFMTRPYVYHAYGIQKLKNFAGQTLGNELENMVMHKFMIGKEALPNEEPFLKAWTNVQLASTLVYNTYSDDDPDKPLKEPREIQRVPAPPEVMGTFSITDQITQAILGSYDASLGINDNQLSGTAIVEGATQSNSAAMPYVVGFMEALNQVARIIIDLLPKYYTTPRTLPIMGIDGKRTFVSLNQPGGMEFSYDENALQVKVEAGVNFAIQKSRALNQLIALSNAIPNFGQFISSAGGEEILDNLEIRGIDSLKLKYQQWMQQQAQAAQQQQQMQMQMMQNNPQMIRAQTEQQRLQLDTQQAQVDSQVKVAELAVQKQAVDNDTLKIMQAAKSDQVKAAVMIDKADAERGRAAVDLAIKATDMHHKHLKETHELMNQREFNE